MEDGSPCCPSVASNTNCVVCMCVCMCVYVCVEGQQRANTLTGAELNI